MLTRLSHLRFVFDHQNLHEQELRLKTGTLTVTTVPSPDFARELKSATLQFHAAFHDHQPQPGAVARADIAAALESVEQPFLIAIRDANATVMNRKYGFRPVASDMKSTATPGSEYFTALARRLVRMWRNRRASAKHRRAKSRA
jgi:hypothetical protein